MDRSPTFLVIIDEKTPVLDEAIEDVRLEIKVVEYKTFDREGVGIAVHAHLFEPLSYAKPPQQIQIIKPIKEIKHPRTGYTGKTIVSFSIHGKEYLVKYWREMLIKTSEVLFDEKKMDFAKVLDLKGEIRPYFTRKTKELRVAEEIRDMAIYVETNLSSNAIVRLCRKMLVLFGYSEQDLSVKLS